MFNHLNYNYFFLVLLLFSILFILTSSSSPTDLQASGDGDVSDEASEDAGDIDDDDNDGVEIQGESHENSEYSQGEEEEEFKTEDEDEDEDVYDASESEEQLTDKLQWTVRNIYDIPKRRIAMDGVALHKDTQHNITLFMTSQNSRLRYDTTWLLDSIASRFASCDHDSGIYKGEKLEGTESLAVFVFKGRHHWFRAESTMEGVMAVIEAWRANPNDEIMNYDWFGCSVQPMCKRKEHGEYQHALSCALAVI